MGKERANITERRREALREFVRASGGHAKVVAAHNLTASMASYLSQLTAAGSTASYGERAAASWEERFKIKDGRLVNPPMAGGRVLALLPPPGWPFPNIQDFAARFNRLGERNKGAIENSVDDMLLKFEAKAGKIARPKVVAAGTNGG